MAGLTQAEQQATLNARFPSTGGTDHIAYSTNGTSEFIGLTRTAVGSTNWAAATAATPSVKANTAPLTSSAATTAGTVTHFSLWSATSGGTQRTDWTLLTQSRTVASGGPLTWAAGAIAVSLD